MCLPLAHCGTDCGDHALGVQRYLLPCEAQHEPTVEDQEILTAPIALKGMPIGVKGTPVHLNGNAQVHIREVEFGDDVAVLIPQGNIRPP